MVYIVCETVDLGYHIVSVHETLSGAKQKCERLNEEYRNITTKSLVNIGYTDSDIDRFFRNKGSTYFIETHEIES